jgi:hypothetical protein
MSRIVRPFDEEQRKRLTGEHALGYYQQKRWKRAI